jgi:hypothetical protein
MHHTRHPIVLLALALAMLTFALGCGSEPQDEGSPYAGLWHRWQAGSDTWLVVKERGDGLVLLWERSFQQPVEQPATLQADGRLTASAVSGDFERGTESVPRYTGVVRDGVLKLTTTTTMTGVDAPISVTLSFTRGFRSRHDAFRRELDRHLKQTAADQQQHDEISAALSAIGMAVREWAQAHGGEAPPADEVRPHGAVGRLLTANGEQWPSVDGVLLLPGERPGRFRYRPRANGYKMTYIGTDGTAGSGLAEDWGPAQ